MNMRVSPSPVFQPPIQPQPPAGPQTDHSAEAHPNDLHHPHGHHHHHEHHAKARPAPPRRTRRQSAAEKLGNGVEALDPHSNTGDAGEEENQELLDSEQRRQDRLTDARHNALAQAAHDAISRPKSVAEVRAEIRASRALKALDLAVMVERTSAQRPEGQDVVIARGVDLHVFHSHQAYWGADKTIRAKTF